MDRVVVAATVESDQLTSRAEAPAFRLLVDEAQGVEGLIDALEKLVVNPVARHLLPVDQFSTRLAGDLQPQQ
jgi:hypothetical protein